MFSNFRLHVTLGRVRLSGLIISIIDNIANTVDLQLLLSDKTQKSNHAVPHTAVPILGVIRDTIPLKWHTLLSVVYCYLSSLLK